MFKDITYDQFWLSRLSWMAIEKAPAYFTKEEREWALEQVEYKYFGEYEMVDSQRIAVEIMVWCTKYSIEECL